MEPTRKWSAYLFFSPGVPSCTDAVSDSEHPARNRKIREAPRVTKRMACFLLFSPFLLKKGSFCEDPAWLPEDERIYIVPSTGKEVSQGSVFQNIENVPDKIKVLMDDFKGKKKGDRLREPRPVP